MSIMLIMLVRELGEFKLIETLAQAITDDNALCIERLNKQGFRLLLPIGDDAAAWNGPSGTQILTTDTLVEGTHFNLDQISWRSLGWKSLAVNLSDVAAMGCKPLYFLVTLGLREDLPVEGLLEMYRGMLELSVRCGGAIIGGDIVRSPVFFVTVTLQGTSSVTSKGFNSPQSVILTRDTCSPGDKIAVTGYLGCSGGGLQMLTQGLKLDTETERHLLQAHNRPEPRVAQGIILAQRGVTSCIDISDGLVDDLWKLSKSSGVGAMINANLVPVDEFLKQAYPQNWLNLALCGGEDYELLFTAPSDVMDRVISKLNVVTSVLGEIVEGPPQVKVLDPDGNELHIANGGWDHFQPH